MQHSMHIVELGCRRQQGDSFSSLQAGFARGAAAMLPAEAAEVAEVCCLFAESLASSSSPQVSRRRLHESTNLRPLAGGHASARQQLPAPILADRQVLKPLYNGHFYGI